MKVTVPKLATAVRTAVVAFTFAAAPAAAAAHQHHPLVKSPSRLHTTTQWVRRHPSVQASVGQAHRYGSTAVVGLESMRDLASLRDRYGFERMRAIPALRAAIVKVPPARLRELLAAAPSDQRIRYVSPRAAHRQVLSMPNDPLVNDLDPATSRPFEWQFTASRVDRALDLTQGDRSIVVGVIDSGVESVPDLAGKIDGLWNVSPDGAIAAAPTSGGNDDTGHGTAVASLIAANVDDGFGMAGFGGKAHVIAVHAGYHGIFYDTSIAVALTKLDALGVRIVNMSLGGPAVSEPILIDAIHKVAADGVLLVAATGNSHEEVSWPAAALQPSEGGRSYGLAVGATDLNGAPAGFSNSGKHLSLVAPGTIDSSCFFGVLVALPSAITFDESACMSRWNGTRDALYGYVSGTSFSAPQVAGVAALVWAARPELRNYQVADIVKQSARRATGAGWTPTMGCGVLDAEAAVALATSRSTPEWSRHDGTSDPCSVDGAQAPAWPIEAFQTISFKRLPGKTMADPDFRVGAAASSGLPVSFRTSGTCTNRGTLIHLSGIGVCAVTASQAGNANFNPARSVVRTFSITNARGKRGPARASN